MVSQVAKIWVYWNCTETKITLKECTPIRLRAFREHEEGYTRTDIVIWKEGDTVFLSENSRGRDCDGLHEHYTFLKAPASEQFPKWERVKEEVEDHTAIAAGY